MREAECVVLIGMPGVGKSTAGVVLAKILNLDFIDTDLLIQRRYGKTLQELIDECGSEGFLKLESDLLCELEAERAVVATGGSAVYGADAMEHLAELGPIVYLKASPAELARRLGALDARGVVRGRCGTDDGIDAISAERAPLYDRYAQLTLDVDGLSLRDVAERLAEIVTSG